MSMVKHSYTVCTLIFSTLGIAAVVNCQDIEAGHVVFVNVLYRHGDRSPISLYRTDPYQNLSYWPDGFGHLTNTGKRQHFELGQWLRRRYDSLLTARYDPDIIYIQSVNLDRTLMSAECNLAGMFPPRGAQVWDHDLSWQPIPVHTIPLNLDKVLNQDVQCPEYSLELERVFSSDKKIRQLNDTFSELFQYISKNSEENVSLKNVGWIRDTLYVESTRNFTLPVWTKPVYPEPLQEASMESFKLETWTPKLARLKTGLLLGEMIENIVNKMKNKTTRNMHVYSAHDETIANLLNALGAFNNVIPPYAACLMVELRKDPKENHFVTLFYRNSTTERPYLMTVAGCTPVCPLDRFVALSQPLVPKDWDQECGIPRPSTRHLITIISIQFPCLNIHLRIIIYNITNK